MKVSLRKWLYCYLQLTNCQQLLISVMIILPGGWMAYLLRIHNILLFQYQIWLRLEPRLLNLAAVCFVTERDMFKLTVYIDYNLDLKTQEKLLKLFMNFERKNRRTKKYIKSKKKLEKIIQ